MVEQKTEFRKIREFGENLNDTFVFLGQNFGPLLKSVFAICGVVMIIQAILSGVYQYQTFGFLQKLIAGASSSSFPIQEIFTWQYFLVVLFPFLVLTSMQVATFSYIKFYMENNRQQPGIDEVWNLFRKYFLRVLGYNFLTGLMILLAFPFCFFPAIYLWVVFVPMTFVAMIENLSFSDAVARCFFLIKQNFWPAFLLYLVVSLLYSFSGSIVGGIVSVIIGLFSYLTTNNLQKTFGIATSFLNIFSYAFYIIFIVSAAFQYFSMTEQKEATGILTRIDQLGRGTTPVNPNEEQF